MSNQSKLTGNKLFIVCPFCQLEQFIIERYGEVFFLTAPAAIYDFNDDLLQFVKAFMKREGIASVYLVGELSCGFIKNAIDQKDYSGLRCASALRKLRADGDTPSSLTAKLLNDQAGKWTQDDVFGQEIKEGRMALHLMLSDKLSNRMEEMALFVSN